MNLDTIGKVDQSTPALRSVGQLLLYWGQLETKLSWSIVTLAPDRAGPHIERDEIARTLSRLLKDFRKAHLAASDNDKSHMARIDDLSRRIDLHSQFRNMLCHGFEAIWLNGNPDEAVLCCWKQYHEMRSQGTWPKQEFVPVADVWAQIEIVDGFLGEVRDLTQALPLAKSAAHS